MCGVSLRGERLLEFVSRSIWEAHIDDTGMKRLTDREAGERICRACGCEFVQDISGWEKEKRDAAIRAALKEGVSIRQMSRPTAVSKAIIEKVARE